MLIDLGKVLAHRFDIESEKIDHHHATSMGHEVSPISIFANVSVETGTSAQSEMSSLGRRDDEARAMERHSPRRQPFVCDQSHAL